MMHTLPTRLARRRARGLSLVELLISMALGLALIAIMLAVYDSSRTASRRQGQLNEIQNNIRTAFDYLATDGRMIGHQGCYTRKPDAPSVAGLSKDSVATNYAVGVEGYDANLGTTDPTMTLTENPANSTDTKNWTASKGSDSDIDDLPVTDIGGQTTDKDGVKSPAGLTPNADVLVMRSITGRPLRLTGDLAAKATNIGIEDNKAKCSSGDKSVSGLCAGSHALIASCANAQFFTVGSADSGVASMTSGLELGKAYPAASTEVFAVQTVAYYVKQGSSGTSPSLYRRVFDGTGTDGSHEEELVPGVETLQVRYGTEEEPKAPATTPNGIRTKNWLRADEVPKWARVVAIRVSLLLRTDTPSTAGITLAKSGLVNDVTVTYPTSEPAFDRQVFTTTIAIRNRISY